MEVHNLTTMNEFILIGISDLPEVTFFMILAVIYQVTLLGNSTILLIIGTEKKLQISMHFFLANLSLLDIFCLSTTVPKMLENLLTEKQSISFFGFALHLYFLVALAGTEVFLLSLMSYDRYEAICFPLHYTLIMSKVCFAQLAGGTWAAGFLHSLMHTVFTFCMSFYKSNQFSQYYCDILPLMALSCPSTYVAEIHALVVTGILGISTFLITLISYVYIISTTLNIQSAVGKHKAFSTCISHLIVVCLFYGTALFTYICPFSSQHSAAKDRLIPVLYVIITPMLNPIIYSLSNMRLKEH